MAKADPREGFVLALLVQYPQLREAGLEVPEEVFWEAEARQVLRDLAELAMKMC